MPSFVSEEDARNLVLTVAIIIIGSRYLYEDIIFVRYYWTMRNKYIKVAHISERKTREIIRLLALMWGKKDCGTYRRSRTTVINFIMYFASISPKFARLNSLLCLDNELRLFQISFLSTTPV